MIVQKVYCDYCGKEKSDIRRIYILKGRKCDAAGDMEDDDYYKDLCPNCMAKILNSIGRGANIKKILPE
jgi:hypothetical protein